MKTPPLILVRGLALGLLSLGAFGISGCSDSPTGPGSGNDVETVASLEIELPDTIIPGREFEVRVVAVGSAGTRPFPEFDGTIGLAVSDGSVTPSSIAVSGGQGGAGVVVQTTASRIEFVASHPNARGSVDVRCAQSGSVLVTSGRFHLLVAADVKTLSDGDRQEESRLVQMPGQMNFSETFSVSAKATHFYDPDNPAGRRDDGVASADGSLIVTSTFDGPERIASMSIESTASAGASYTGSDPGGPGGGTASAAINVRTEFDFTVENVPVTVEFSNGEFEKSSYRVVKIGGGTVLNPFGETQAATIDPGNYRFIVNYTENVLAAGANGGGAFVGSAKLIGTLSFTEAPPDE
jgi:hypothetical protein